MSMRDTGSPRVDAKTDFTRERRRRAVAQVASRLRTGPSDVSAMLPFEEVVAALGRRGQADRGVQTIALDSIVGTVDRARGEFDRAFRPASTDVRGRWERIAEMRRRGEPVPPIEVFRVGELHFVRDGHHRVSVARAHGDKEIDAHVIEVLTQVPAGKELQLTDLPLKAHERLFRERVPLPPEQAARIELSDQWRYAQLATLIEAWGYRASHDRGHLLTREEMAAAWFIEEFQPVAELLREYGFGGPGTDAERFLRVAILRYLVLQTHDWSDEVLDRLFGDGPPVPGAEDDTLVHQIRRELR